MCSDYRNNLTSLCGQMKLKETVCIHSCKRARRKILANVPERSEIALRAHSLKKR